MSAYYFYYKNNLYHHGVKGMHWGRLNGPPYPIGSGPKKPMKEREAAARKRKKEWKQLEGNREHKLNYTSLELEKIKRAGGRVLVNIAAMTIPGFGLAWNTFAISANAINARNRMDSKDYTKKEGPPEKLSELTKKTKTSTMAEDMKRVNPRGLTKKGSVNNCGYCTAAMEMRVRGYDVRARKNAQGIVQAKYYDWFKDVEIKHPSVERNPKESRRSYIQRSYDNLCNEIEKEGDGSRGYVGIQYEKFSAGHSMYWTVNNGKVTFWDTQNNTNKTDRVFSLSDPKKYSYARLDNLEINEDITESCISVDREKKNKK